MAHLLLLQNYHVVSLNSRLAKHTLDLKASLARGMAAYPDQRRSGFYDVELRNGRAYIHVRYETKTVYLIACLTRSALVGERARLEDDERTLQVS